MDLQPTAEDMAFEAEVEEFLTTNLDDELRRAGTLSSGICGAP